MVQQVSADSALPCFFGPLSRASTPVQVLVCYLPEISQPQWYVATAFVHKTQAAYLLCKPFQHDQMLMSIPLSGFACTFYTYQVVNDGLKMSFIEVNTSNINGTDYQCKRVGLFKEKTLKKCHMGNIATSMRESQQKTREYKFRG